MLQVISLNRVSKYNTFWNCVCDCGNSVIVRGAYIKNSHTKSCGCLNTSRKSRILGSHLRCDCGEDEKRQWKNSSLCYKHRSLWHKYGLTPDAYANLLELQNYKCKLCGEDMNDDVVVDHCHRKEAIRGLVHRRCNIIIGYVESDADKISAVQVYLAKTGS